MKFIELKKNCDEPSVEFLYFLLKTRKYSISHKSLPKYQEHLKFVRNFPYYKWFIIEYLDQKIGAFYIQKDNSIGLDIIPKYYNLIFEIISHIEIEYEPLPKIASVRSEEFFFNVSPENKELHAILISAGYKISQISFVKEKKIS